MSKRILLSVAMTILLIGLLSSLGLAQTVTHWIYPLGPDVEVGFAELVAEFEKENPGITVDVQVEPWGGRYPKLFTALATGQGPDVGLLTIDIMMKFANAGLLLPLQDKLPQSYWDDVDPSILSQHVYHGNIYYAPFDKEVGAMLYNTTIFAEAGLDAQDPQFTWDDLKTISEKALALGYTGWTYDAASATANWSFWPVLRQAGGTVFNEARTAVAFDGPAGVEALEFVVSMFEKNYVSRQWLTDSQGTFFIEGRQAVNSLASVGALLNIRRDNPDLEQHLAVGPPAMGKERVGFGAARSFAVFSNAKNPDAAVKWVEFLSRSENQRFISERISGQVTALLSAREGLYANDPLMAEYLNYVQYAHDEEMHEFGRDIMPFVVGAVQGAILGQRTPEAALQEAAVRANNLLP